MSGRGNTPQMGVYETFIAAEVRSRMARKRLSDTAMARRLGVTQPYFSRRKLGYVPFTAAEFVILCDAMEEDVASVLGSAKREARKTNPCLSDSEWVLADELLTRYAGHYVKSA